MKIEKNPTKVAESIEEFEVISGREITVNRYKNIEDVLELIEILIDKRKTE